MDAKISTKNTDVVAVTTEPRPTPTPFRTSFSDVMARGAGSVVGGAEAAMTTLPGTSVMAVAVRGGAAGVTAPPLGVGFPYGGIGAPIGGIGAPIGFGAPIGGIGLPVGIGAPVGGIGGMSGTVAEGPGAVAGANFGTQFLASANAAASGDGGAAASLQQSEQSNLYYLQLQQQVNQQSQAFEALSNVMKSESDTVKNAISNMH